MPLPNFVIVGAAKSGSTSLHQNLRKHPDIFTPGTEVHYFYAQASGKYEKSLEWYEQHFGGGTEARMIGEKTPQYSYVPKVAPRIYEALPNVRLVWIFRDPVRRAHSHYWFNVNQGKEPLSFEKTLQKERNNERKNEVERAYLKAGLYAEQVERYLKWFDLDAMFFCTLQELKKEPVDLFMRLYSFLGVAPDFARRIDFERRKTTTHTPYSPLVRHLVLTRFGGESLARKIEYKLNSRPQPGYPQMEKDTKKKLSEYYRSSNQRLQKVTGLSIDHWTEPNEF